MSIQAMVDVAATATKAAQTLGVPNPDAFRTGVIAGHEALRAATQRFKEQDRADYLLGHAIGKYLSTKKA